jgi:hypothetical protein
MEIITQCSVSGSKLSDSQHILPKKQPKLAVRQFAQFMASKGRVGRPAQVCVTVNPMSLEYPP